MIADTGASREQCARFLDAAVRATTNLALGKGARLPKLGTLVAGMRTRRYAHPKTGELGVSYTPFVQFRADQHFLRQIRRADVQR